MGVLLLDIRNFLLGYSIAYVGTLRGMLVEPRGLLVPALLSNAAGIIVFHTHPSGDPEPSDEDVTMTQELAESAFVVGVGLYDHIVIGEYDRWCSMARRPDWPTYVARKGVVLR